MSNPNSSKLILLSAGIAAAAYSAYLYNNHEEDKSGSGGNLGTGGWSSTKAVGGGDRDDDKNGILGDSKENADSSPRDDEETSDSNDDNGDERKSAKDTASKGLFKVRDASDNDEDDINDDCPCEESGGRENKKRSFVDEFIVRKPHEEQLEDDDKRDQGWFGARNSNKDDETDNDHKDSGNWFDDSHWLFRSTF